MAQYYEVLNQSEKNSDQPFYNNVEDQTLQYVITPDKTQVQYPTQQIVVTTSGDQLMVVDGQPQQIVIDQSTIAYQGQQIQQSQVLQIPQVIQQQQPQQVQVQTQQFAVIQDGNLSNGAQQIFFMEGSPSSGNQVIVEQSVVQQAQAAPQPIVLNHQLSQNNTVVRAQNRALTPAQVLQGIRGANRQPPMQQPRLQMRPSRNPTPTQSVRQISPGQVAIRAPSQQQQIKVQNTAAEPQVRLPNQVQIRQSPPQQQLRLSSPLVRAAVSTQQQFRPQQANQLRQPNQVVRPTTAGQQIRVPSQLPQLRIPTQVQKNALVNSKFQGLVQIQQQLQQKAAAANSIMELAEMESKSNDDQETVSLPDGMNISVASYKKILAEQKARTLNRPTSTTPHTNSSTPVNQTNTTPATKRKAPARSPRSIPRAGRAPPKGRNVQQFGPSPNQPQPHQQVNNDPAQYAMMNQQQMSNSPPANTYQNQQQLPPLVQQQQPQVKPSQANYVIQPPKLNPKPQQQRPLPSYIPSSQIQKIIENTPVSEEFTDSIRMLVLLENGEQRLITFTLPKEACTIQEILEQVNVPFQSNTNIQVTEANSNGINYIVTVGNVPPLGYEEEEPSHMAEEPAPVQPSQIPPSTLTQNVPSEQPMEHSQSPQPMPGSPASQSEPPSKASSPEPSKEIPKLLPGMLALCGACGYLSEDFSRCIRCQRKLPDNVKAITATLRAAAVQNQKKDMSLLQQQAQQQQMGQLQPQVQQQPQGQQQQTVGQLPQQNKINLPLKAQSPTKKKITKKVIEQESVHVISSDEEDDEKTSKLTDNLLQKLGSSVTISPVTKEPSVNEIQRHCSVKLEDALSQFFVKSASNPDQEEADIISTALKFRTIRIGSYRCIPTDKVIIDSTQVIMMVPHPEKEKGIKTIAFEKSEIVKVLASFNASLPVIFYYLNPLEAKKIRKELDMTADGDYYYDPLSNVDESFRRITFLPDEINEDEKKCIQAIYGQPVNILDELNAKEANDILIKTCPKEVARSTLLGMGTFTEIKQLLTYPPEGRGRISINTEDYVCLAQDQFLNDVIIDFYLKYLVEHLPSDQKAKVHVFSTFFYKRLTTKPAKASRRSQPTELDPTLSPAQKRHARVKTWTKNVNLFEKDFIIVPINENAHWFLAIICFPGMDGCQTWDGKPYKLEIKSRKKKKIQITSIGAVSVTPVKQEKTEKPVCEDPVLSDKDEAEGDESEMDSDDSEEVPIIPSGGSTTVSTVSPTPTPIATPVTLSPPVTTPRIPKEPRPPIKQPCILIFDSLAGANRSRVVATLRDYLTCEYKAKLGKEKIYNKDVIKGANPKVPQQNNFTDCGLYVLQYVEHFFMEPITDYNMPIKQIQHWFEELIVTRKREDIANLIKHLMQEYGKDVNSLPDISFPTINGKLVEHEFDDEEEEEEEEEMMDEDGEVFKEEHDLKNDSVAVTLDTTKSESFSETISSTEEIKSQDVALPMKPSMTDSSDFVAQPVLNPKPDLSEFPRQTNKDTLSILKAKRIIRHKTNGPEMKKTKSDD